METKESLRERLNKGVAPLGNLKISLVHLILLIIINLSLAAIIVNLFVRGKGVFEWWSVYLTAFLIFAYLIMRIFTSSGIILGRQVTFLITLFNLFLNLMKVFGMVKSDQYWELTFLIPLVNLICLLFWCSCSLCAKKVQGHNRAQLKNSAGQRNSHSQALYLAGKQLYPSRV